MPAASRSRRSEATTADLTPEERTKLLLKKFPASMHKTNSSGQTYITVNPVIERLDEALGRDGWQTEGSFLSLVEHSEKTKSGKLQYLGSAGITLVVGDSKSFGAGACINFDPDTAIKGAVSQAIKKAAVQVGVGRYLQEEEEREVVHQDRQAAAGGDLQLLKNSAYRYALKHDSEPDLTGTSEQIAAKVAAVIGLGAAEMQDAAKLQAKLTELGVL